MTGERCTFVCWIEDTCARQFVSFRAVRLQMAKQSTDYSTFTHSWEVAFPHKTTRVISVIKLCTVLPFRSTPSMSSSGRVGGTRGWSLTDPWRFYPSTTSWLVRSGLPIHFSTTERNRWPITWRLPTNCCGWSTTERFSTQWGETLLKSLLPLEHDGDFLQPCQ